MTKNIISVLELAYIFFDSVQKKSRIVGKHFFTEKLHVEKNFLPFIFWGHDKISQPKCSTTIFPGGNILTKNMPCEKFLNDKNSQLKNVFPMIKYPCKKKKKSHDKDFPR